MKKILFCFIFILLPVSLIAQVETKELSFLQKRDNDSEAKAYLGQIRTLELSKQLATGTFVKCSDNKDCSDKLGLVISTDNWAFRVSQANKNSYCAEAIGNSGTSNWYIAELDKSLNPSPSELSAVFVQSGTCAEVMLPEKEAEIVPEEPEENPLVQEAYDREAQSWLKLIQSAEKIYHLENNSYLSCDSIEDCNARLGIELSSGIWKYQVVTNDQGGFCASATSEEGNDWFITESGTPQEGSCEE